MGELEIAKWVTQLGGIGLFAWLVYRSVERTGADIKEILDRLSKIEVRSEHLERALSPHKDSKDEP